MRSQAPGRRAAATWRDQRVMNVHWTVGSDKIRLVRRDRTQRNLDLVEIDVATNSTKTLLTESVENAALEPQNVRYVRPGGDMLWWSERSRCFCFGPTARRSAV